MSSRWHAPAAVEHSRQNHHACKRDPGRRGLGRLSHEQCPSSPQGARYHRKSQPTLHRAPSEVPELTATADEPSPSIAGLPVRFLNAGPGHFLANGLALPASGEWTVAFHVRTSDIDEYTATAHLTVR